VTRRYPSAVVWGAALLAAYAAFLIPHTTRVAGGSDSSGYLNLTRNILEGRIVRDLPQIARYELPAGMAFEHVFVPLGHVPGPRPNTMAPFYPPGLPLLMAGAVKLSGFGHAAYFVPPLFGWLGVWLMFLLLRDLQLSATWAIAGASLLAAFPTWTFFALQPMSDAVATTISIAAILFARRARSSGVWAVAAGAALGLAVLVRPTNGLLLLPLAFALPWTLRSAAAFFLGGAPFGLFLAIWNRALYGSPFRTGYGGVLSTLSTDHFSSHFVHYTFWMTALTGGAVIAGWMISAWDSRIAWRDRALLLSWLGVFFAFYCFYGPYEAWWYTRFLMPGLPAAIAAALLVTRHLLDAQARVPRAPLAGSRASVAAFVLWLFSFATGTIYTGEHGVHRNFQSERVYERASRMAEQRVPEGGLVLAMQMSGALEHYTRVPYAMWNWLDEGRATVLDRALRGRGGNWYALLAPFEVESVRGHFPDPWTELGREGDVVLWKLPPLRGAPKAPTM
jgi:hypothetical protein